MVTIDPNNLIFSLISVLLGKVVTSDQYDVSNPIAKLGKYNTEVILTPKLIGPYYVKHSIKYNRINITRLSPIYINRSGAVNLSDLLPLINSLFDLSSHVTVSHLNQIVNFTIPPLQSVDIIDAVLPPLSQNSIYLLLNPNSYLFIGTTLLYAFRAPIFIDFEVTQKYISAPIFIDFEVTEKRIPAPIFFNFEVTEKVVVTPTPTPSPTPTVTPTPSPTPTVTPTSTPAPVLTPDEQCPPNGIQYQGTDFKNSRSVWFNDRQAAIDFSFSSYNSSDSHFRSDPARLNPNPTIEGTRVYYQMEIYYNTYYGFQWRFFDYLELTPATRTCVPTATVTPTVTVTPTSSPSSTPAPVTGTWIRVCGEGESAALPIGTTVRYGSRGAYITLVTTNSPVVANNTYFGGDPIFGVAKELDRFVPDILTQAPTSSPTQTATPTATVTPTSTPTSTPAPISIPVVVSIDGTLVPLSKPNIVTIEGVLPTPAPSPTPVPKPAIVSVDGTVPDIYVPPASSNKNTLTFVRLKSVSTDILFGGPTV